MEVPPSQARPRSNKIRRTGPVLDANRPTHLLEALVSDTKPLRSQATSNQCQNVNQPALKLDQHVVFSHQMCNCKWLSNWHCVIAIVRNHAIFASIIVPYYHCCCLELIHFLYVRPFFRSNSLLNIQRDMGPTPQISTIRHEP